MQLRMAREANLPVIIHSREAEDDTVQILSEELKGYERGGVMHCFMGSRAVMESVVELGFMISFAGVITFKKAEDLREVARRVPTESLLIETDCPYLTPVPFRGKRNEPARVVEVAKCLADIRGLSVGEVGQQTTRNFERFFGLKVSEEKSGGASQI